MPLASTPDKVFFVNIEGAGANFVDVWTSFGTRSYEYKSCIRASQKVTSIFFLAE